MGRTGPFVVAAAQRLPSLVGPGEVLGTVNARGLPAGYLSIGRLAPRGLWCGGRGSDRGDQSHVKGMVGRFDRIGSAGGIAGTHAFGC